MWIVDRLRGDHREARAIPDDVFDHEWGGSPTASGVPVDVAAAMRSSAYWACVNLLARDISRLPWDVVEGDGPARRTLPRPAWMRQPGPNPNETFGLHLSDVVVSMLTDGNAFTEALPSRRAPETVRALDPSRISVREDAGRVTYAQGDARMTPATIVHVPLVRLPGRLRGLSVVDAAREGIGTGLASQEYGNRFFSNGTTMTGLIEAPQGVPMTDEAIERIRSQFALRHQGLRRSHALGILTGGATWRQLSTTPKDAMLVDLWQWVVEDTARYFGIPPYKVGSTQPGAVAYASTTNARLEYATGPVDALAGRIGEAYSGLLPEGQRLRADLRGLMRGDHAQRATYYGALLDRKVYSRDEVRAWEDMPPADEAPGIGTEHGGYLETVNNTPATQGGTDA